MFDVDGEGYRGLPDKIMTTELHKRQARLYTAGGESLTMRDWAKRLKCSKDTLRSRVSNRIKRGWTLEKALLTPTARPEDLARRNAARSPWRQGNTFLFRSRES